MSIWVQDIGLKIYRVYKQQSYLFCNKNIKCNLCFNKHFVDSEGFKILKKRFKNIKLFYNSYEIPNFKNINKYNKVKNLLENNFCITYTGINAAQIQYIV